jgi:hypothetical protein
MALLLFLPSTRTLPSLDSSPRLFRLMIGWSAGGVGQYMAPFPNKPTSFASGFRRYCPGLEMQNPLKHTCGGQRGSRNITCLPARKIGRISVSRPLQNLERRTRLRQCTFTKIPTGSAQCSVAISRLEHLYVTVLIFSPLLKSAFK